MLTAEDCARYSRQLISVIADLEELAGLRILDFNRLSRAQRLLADVGSVGELPTNMDDLRRVAYALSDAAEFAAICDFLPGQALSTVVQDLKHAVKGDLDRFGTKKPFQFQTQLFVGGILNAAGCLPRSLPTGRSQQPDFVIEKASLQYGVEVKRPESLESLDSQLNDARRQLKASGLSGVVVIDLSDCFKRVGCEEISTTPERFLQSVFVDLDNVIYNHSQRRINPRFRPVQVLVLLLRAYAVSASEKPYIANSWGCSFSRYYAGGAGTLNDWRSRWLLGLFDEGLRRAGYVPVDEASRGSREVPIDSGPI